MASGNVWLLRSRMFSPGQPAMEQHQRRWRKVFVALPALLQPGSKAVRELGKQTSRGAERCELV